MMTFVLICPYRSHLVMLVTLLMLKLDISGKLYGAEVLDIVNNL